MKIKYLLILLLNIPMILFIHNYVGVDAQDMSKPIAIIFVLTFLLLAMEFIVLLAVLISYIINDWNSESSWLNNSIFKNKTR